MPDQADAPAPPVMEPPANPRLPWVVTLAATFLASLSGLVLILYAFGGIPLEFTGPFIAFPAGLLTLGLSFAVRHRTASMRRLAQLVIMGTIVGFTATLAYDVARVTIQQLFQFDFDPFRAQRMFGSMMLQTDPNQVESHVAGWIYHFLNGANFAVMFALLRPKGGLWWGLGWSLVLEAAMATVYPIAVEIAPDVGFMTISIGGHVAWGATLGLGMQAWHRRGWQ